MSSRKRSRRLRVNLITCSGYKPDLFGWLAARRLGIPVVAVCHGWTVGDLEGARQ